MWLSDCSRRYIGWMGMITSNSRLALALAIALYLIWMTVTYLLEGYLLTLHRPEATLTRLAHALVANVLIGLGVSTLAVRALSDLGTISPRLAGFQGTGTPCSIP